MMTKRNTGQLTPLEQLWAEKRQLRLQCRETETKIKGDWQYVRSNAGHLLFSGIVSIFMSGRKSDAGQKDASRLPFHSWGYVFWQIARPMLYRWMGEMGWQLFKGIFGKKR